MLSGQCKASTHPSSKSPSSKPCPWWKHNKTGKKPWCPCPRHANWRSLSYSQRDATLIPQYWVQQLNLVLYLIRARFVIFVLRILQTSCLGVEFRKVPSRFYNVFSFGTSGVNSCNFAAATSLPSIVQLLVQKHGAIRLNKSKTASLNKHPVFENSFSLTTLTSHFWKSEQWNSGMQGRMPAGYPWMVPSGNLAKNDRHINFT